MTLPLWGRRVRVRATDLDPAEGSGRLFGGSGTGVVHCAPPQQYAPGGGGLGEGLGDGVGEGLGPGDGLGCRASTNHMLGKLSQLMRPYLGHNPKPLKLMFCLMTFTQLAHRACVGLAATYCENVVCTAP